MKRFLTLIVLCSLLGSLPLAAASRSKKTSQPQPVTPQIQSQWNGARVGILGDSITDDNQLATQDIYWHQLIDILGIEPYCYGISGHQTGHILGQAQKLLADHGQDVDAILIFIGTNDFNSSIPPGVWFREEAVKVNRNGVTTTLRHRIPVMEHGTVRGEINLFMSWLKHQYPTQQIILLTPIHRAYFNCHQYNVQQDEYYANPLGLYLDDYVQIIKETADVWAVPVIDLAALCGLFPLEIEHTRYFREAGYQTEHTPAEDALAVPGTPQALVHHDLLHPNTEGHRRMAYALAYQLLGYPVKF